MKDRLWKIITIVFLAINIPWINGFILAIANPYLDMGVTRLIQSTNSRNLQIFDVDVEIPYIDLNSLAQNKSIIVTKPFTDRYTFIKENDPGFNNLVALIKEKNKSCLIDKPSIILNHQDSDRGDVANLYTTERTIYFVKLPDKEIEVLKPNGHYDYKQIQFLSNKKAVSMEKDIVFWIKENKIRRVGILQFTILTIILLLIIFPRFQSWCLEAWHDAFKDKVMDRKTLIKTDDIV